MRKSFKIISLALLGTILSLPVAAAENALRSLGRPCNIDLGAAVGDRALVQDPLYSERLVQNFSVVTPENAMKWATVQRTPERFDTGPAEAIVRFAQAQEMQVRGHTLVWHQAIPSWVVERAIDPPTAAHLLQTWIQRMVGQFRGRVGAWDVVNEAFAANGQWRDSLWYRRLGPSYIEQAFRWAAAADPSAKLFYNDYGIETPGPKTEAVVRLVQDLQRRGVPIAGIGMQMHLRLAQPPDPEAVAATMRRFAELGLEVQITEMDVQLVGSAGSRRRQLRRQAQLYRDILEVCIAAPNCATLVVWGVGDRYSWRRDRANPQGNPNDAPLLLDDRLRPKPAYWAVGDRLAECQLAPVEDKSKGN